MQEQQQVVPPAGLAVGAGHVEAAERLAADQCAGTLTVEIVKISIAMRKKAGLTQEELAAMLKTKKSNISRLENVNSQISPKISTIEEYAKAIGYNVEINFVPSHRST